ncbi:hypothetical protein [Azorhizobium sp. AG788]|uniref:hypothetical protein n=1 Tax=Azorhizobium sp. AG788 TaxID=2183897 RepID=UPI0031392129
MSTVIPFPITPRGSTKVVSGASAQIIILPVVRIERHVEPAPVAAKAARLPRKRQGPVASGGGQRAR